MINGNINEFTDKLWSGEELIFVYNEKKYFTQGFITDEGEYYLGIQMWEPEAKILWEISENNPQTNYEEFMKQPIFDGKTFWEIEKDTEWVDE